MLLGRERSARCTAVRPTPYSSGIDEYQVLYITAFSCVCTLISCALSTQGRGRVGLLLLLSIQRGRARSIYRAAYTAGYPPLSERHHVGGRVSILGGIIVIYPPTRLRRRLYSSRFDEYRVLYLSVFSYVYTLISSILSTQGRGRVGLLLLLRIYRGGAIAQFAKSITIHSLGTGHHLHLLLM